MKAIVEKIISIEFAKLSGTAETTTYKFLSIPVYRTIKRSESGILLHPPGEGEVVSFTESSK